MVRVQNPNQVHLKNSPTQKNNFLELKIQSKYIYNPRPALTKNNNNLEKASTLHDRDRLLAVTHQTCLKLSRNACGRGFVLPRFDVRASTQPQNNNKANQR